MGYTGGASQKGMSMGGVRHVADIRADDMTKEGSSVIGGQVHGFSIHIKQVLYFRMFFFFHLKINNLQNLVCN
jgi:hypothetical protein